MCLALISLCSYAQTTVKSVVPSATDKEPLIGATVQVKGSDTSAITGLKGNYLLPNVPANAVLVFSPIGYENMEIKTSSQTVIYEWENQKESSDKGISFDESRDLLFPMHLYEISMSNGSITQNPGWN